MTTNIPMHGLRAAAGLTKQLRGPYHPAYYQLSYDRQTGRVLMDYHHSIGQNSWTRYHDPDIITIGNLTGPMTQAQIAEQIRRALAHNPA